MAFAKKWMRFAAVATVLVTGDANAAVRVVGSTLAQACYVGARAERESASDLRACDRSLSEEGLSARDHAATRVNRGILRMYAGNFSGALNDYDSAIERMPELAEAHVNRGIALLRLEAPNAAVEASASFTRGIELATAKPEVAYYMRAITHEMRGNAQGAYADYRRASELKPNWDDPAVQLRRFKVVSRPTG